MATALQGNRPKPSWRISASNVFVGAPARGTPPSSQLYLPATRWVIANTSSTTAATPSTAKGRNAARAGLQRARAQRRGRRRCRGRRPARSSGPVPSVTAPMLAFGPQAVADDQRGDDRQHGQHEAEQRAARVDAEREADERDRQIAPAPPPVGRPGEAAERAQRQRQRRDQRRVRRQLARLEHEERHRAQRQRRQQRGARAQQAAPGPVDRHQRADGRQRDRQPRAQLARAEDADAQRGQQHRQRVAAGILAAGRRVEQAGRSARCRAPARPASAPTGPRNRSATRRGRQSATAKTSAHAQGGTRRSSSTQPRAGPWRAPGGWLRGQSFGRHGLAGCFRDDAASKPVAGAAASAAGTADAADTADADAAEAAAAAAPAADAARRWRRRCRCRRCRCRRCRRLRYRRRRRGRRRRRPRPTHRRCRPSRHSCRRCRCCWCRRSPRTRPRSGCEDEARRRSVACVRSQYGAVATQSPSDVHVPPSATRSVQVPAEQRRFSRQGGLVASQVIPLASLATHEYVAPRHHAVRSGGANFARVPAQIAAVLGHLGSAQPLVADVALVRCSRS